MSSDTEAVLAESLGADPAETLAGAIRSAFHEPLAALSDREAEALLDVADEDFSNGMEPLGALPNEFADTRLAGFRDLAGWVCTNVLEFVTKSPQEALRQALQFAVKDTVFDLDKYDSTAKQLNALVGPEIDFLVAGHTHLVRALPRTGGGAYFNTGTWARLFGLAEAVLDDPVQFQAVLQVLKMKDIAALDGYPGLSRRRLTCAAIWENAVPPGCRAQSSAELREYEPNTTPPWTAVPNTQFIQP